MTNEANVQQLLDIEAIKQLKARYFRCMDTKDWDGFAGVFRDAPESTEQILEPALYFSRRKPAKIRLPKVKPGRGFKKVIGGEVGQLDHYVLLKQYAGEEAADELAPKWRGAAFSVLEDKKKDQAVLVYASEWESEADDTQ